MVKEKTMIEVYKDTKKDIMLFKIQTDAKNVPDVMEIIINKLKEELNSKNLTSQAIKRRFKKKDE